MLRLGLLDGEKFLREFPQMKMELEKCIRELRALADKIQKTHRDCTISNVVATSTGVISGVLTITGLALAPLTAGVSLGLTATGMGLGTAAAVTSVSATIVDHSVRLSAKAKASKLVSIDSDTQEEEKTLVSNIVKFFSIMRKCTKDSKVIEKNINAFKLAKANPGLAANARRFMTNGSISVQKGRQVQKAFEGTALAMTKGARMVGMASTGIFLLMDLASLVKESKHLYEGAKTESADDLRLKASMVEKKHRDGHDSASVELSYLVPVISSSY
ncbi:PREDICTED: apolipoprotein L3-like [Elephantulus edwardii]|uniref:apolipoprotein L3-like n=1 Tax=Elephantulus edwardii TaxID=28737 RepID=UPI0003F08098|nr:PREDICTED: apolipoprotein L3-like [Elephantulus edwardii]